MRHAIVPGALLAAAALAGCGQAGPSTGGAADRVAQAPATAAATTATAAAPPASVPNDRLTLEQLLHRSAAALAKVRGYHVAGTEVAGGAAVVLAGQVDGDGAVDLSERFTTAFGGTDVVRLRTVGGRYFLRGNRAFWAHTAGGASGAAGLARRAAGRWVELPPASGKQLAASARALAPATAAACLISGAGRLSQVGRRNVDGIPALVVRSTPQSGGQRPGRLSLARHGAPYPLRIQRLGPPRGAAPAGTGCPQPSADAPRITRSDLHLSHFDEAVRIRVPAHAVPMQRLAAAGGPRA